MSFLSRKRRSHKYSIAALTATKTPSKKTRYEPSGSQETSIVLARNRDLFELDRDREHHRQDPDHLEAYHLPEERIGIEEEYSTYCPREVSLDFGAGILIGTGRNVGASPTLEGLESLTNLKTLGVVNHHELGPLEVTPGLEFLRPINMKGVEGLVKVRPQDLPIVRGPGMYLQNINWDCYPQMGYARWLWEHFFKNYERETVLLVGKKRDGSGWLFFVPKQEGSLGHTSYNFEQACEQFYVSAQYVGTIHSHPGNSAEPSSTDTGDWADPKKAGLHLILARDLSYTVTASFGGILCKVKDGSIEGEALIRAHLTTQGGHKLKSLLGAWRPKRVSSRKRRRGTPLVFDLEKDTLGPVSGFTEIEASLEIRPNELLVFCEGTTIRAGQRPIALWRASDLLAYRDKSVSHLHPRVLGTCGYDQLLAVMDRGKDIV